MRDDFDKLWRMVRDAPQDEAATAAVNVQPLEAAAFRTALGTWYALHARELPWRGIRNPYATWLSEIMLQQTRVATVIDRYAEFLRQFPTLEALAAADESAVLALWSGLGYYRRARMLHRAARFVVTELGGELPHTAAELRTLPGVGDYTAAAVASIAYGESIAVVDGNVERVLLRVLGRAEEKSAAVRRLIGETATSLLPAAAASNDAGSKNGMRSKNDVGKPNGMRSKNDAGNPHDAGNPPGDHNQAMMELGATICLPRAPLCLHCPVMASCRTRGEHVTAPRGKPTSREVAHLLLVRKRGTRTEVLLERRSAEASLMAGMLELPPLPLEAVAGREPVLRVRHAITNTNYYVGVWSEGVHGRAIASDSLRAQVPAAPADLAWHPAARLAELPLTGLARKCLQRLGVMHSAVTLRR